MNVQIITSSYPAYPDDPSGTAGLFVRSFALELRDRGHKVIVQPVGRKPSYEPDEGLIIDPLPWGGGDRELASLNLFSVRNMFVIWDFFKKARKKVVEDHRNYRIDRTLCMWAVPSGLLGCWMRKELHKPYDVWALGSDIWKIKKIPFLGKWFLKEIIGRADRVFADGIELCRSVEKITGCRCGFLPSSRVLPEPRTADDERYGAGILHMVFVGRYHVNKGPDLLLEAVLKLREPYRKKLRIHMYGLGPLKGSLESFIAEHDLQDIVELNGAIDAQNLADVFCKVGYLIIPSRIESIPVVFSDALQSGVPVISTPVGDLKSLIEAHGCGILAEDVSADGIARAIEQACDADRTALALKAKQLAGEFEVGQVVKKWTDL